MHAMQATGASAATPMWMILFMSAVTLVGGYYHWRFKSGRHLREDDYRGRPTSRDFDITLGYMALPSTISAASMTLLLILFAVAPSATKSEIGIPVAVLALTTVGSAIWMAKEFYYPTKRRTPGWLHRERSRSRVGR